SDVTVSTSGSDWISGPPACTSPQTPSSDTSGPRGTGSFVNQAGLSTDAAPLTIKLDKTAPTISIISPGAGPYLLNAAVFSSYSCSDAMSGVSSCTGPP